MRKFTILILMLFVGLATGEALTQNLSPPEAEISYLVDQDIQETAMVSSEVEINRTEFRQDQEKLISSDSEIVIPQTYEFEIPVNSVKIYERYATVPMIDRHPVNYKPPLFINNESPILNRDRANC